MPYNTLQSKLHIERSMMKFDKHTLGKRFSKFLSKMFWHLNQVVPNYSSTNHCSIDKHVLNSDPYRQSKINKDHNQRSYAARYQTRLIRQRTSTLMSIPEENEI